MPSTLDPFFIKIIKIIKNMPLDKINTLLFSFFSFFNQLASAFSFNQPRVSARNTNEENLTWVNPGQVGKHCFTDGCIQNASRTRDHIHHWAHLCAAQREVKNFRKTPPAKSGHVYTAAGRSECGCSDSSTAFQTRIRWGSESVRRSDSQLCWFEEWITNKKGWASYKTSHMMI